MKLTDFKSHTNPVYMDTINKIIEQSNCYTISCDNCPFCSENNAIDEKECCVNNRYRDKSYPTWEEDLLLTSNAKHFKRLVEESKMKRIDIRKNRYEDMVITVENTHILGQKIITFGNDDLKIKVGEKSTISIQQANTILAPFNYELYQSTNWSKVEVGSKLKFTDGRTQYETTFYDYVEKSHQVIVMENGLVKVYNESEVEVV